MKIALLILLYICLETIVFKELCATLDYLTRKAGYPLVVFSKLPDQLQKSCLKTMEPMIDGSLAINLILMLLISWPLILHLVIIARAINPLTQE